MKVLAVSSEAKWKALLGPLILLTRRDSCELGPAVHQFVLAVDRSLDGAIVSKELLLRFDDNLV